MTVSVFLASKGRESSCELTAHSGSLKEVKVAVGIAVLASQVTAKATDAPPSQEDATQRSVGICIDQTGPPMTREDTSDSGPPPTKASTNVPNRQRLRTKATFEAAVQTSSCPSLLWPRRPPALPTKTDTRCLPTAVAGLVFVDLAHPTRHI